MNIPEHGLRLHMGEVEVEYWLPLKFFMGIAFPTSQETPLDFV